LRPWLGVRSDPALRSSRMWAGDPMADKTAIICDVAPEDSLIASALADLVTVAVAAGRDGDGVSAVMQRVATVLELVRAERAEAVVEAVEAGRRLGGPDLVDDLRDGLRAALDPFLFSRECLPVSVRWVGPGALHVEAHAAGLCLILRTVTVGPNDTATDLLARIPTLDGQRLAAMLEVDLWRVPPAARRIADPTELHLT